MKLGKILLLMMLALVGAVGFVGCTGCRGYNTAITLDEDVNAAWAQVENQLQRRFDLIPNIVETVKGTAAHEEKVFTNIANARKAYSNAKSVGAKVKAANGFESALSRLLVIREAYPDLKANQSFMKLQDTVEGTENRLSVERKRYNDAVKDLNTFTRKLLGRLYASLAGVEKAEYFEVTDEAKEVPKVDFGGDSKPETPTGG